MSVAPARKAAAAAKITKRARAASLTATDYQRLAEFRYLLRRFLVFSEQAAQHAGLTAQQHQGLLAIKGSHHPSGIAIGELAERLAIRHHSAVGLIDRLVANGLVHRRGSADDRRQVFVSLTAKAEGVLAKLSLAHRDELERLAPLLQVLLGYFEGEVKNTAARDRSGK